MVMQFFTGAVSALQINSGMIRRLMTGAVVAVALLSGGAASAETFGLTNEQIQKLKNLGSDSRKEIETHRDVLKKARVDLAGVYGAYQLDDERAQLLMGKINRAQKGLLDGLLKSQVEIRQIMTAEQFSGFSEMVKARARGMEIVLDVPLLPAEDGAWESEIAARLRDGKFKPEQEKYVKVAKWVTEKKPESISRLRKSSQQLGEAYLKYELDQDTAKKLVAAVHRDQVALTWMLHKRHQAVRGLLTESEFERLKQDVAKKVREAQSKRVPPGGRGKK